MDHRDGDKISEGSLLFCKVILPAMLSLFCLGWLGIVIAVGLWPVAACASLLMVAGSAQFARFYFCLKEVRLGERGLLVADRRARAVVPYEAIANIAQDPRNNSGIVEVELDRDTPLGRRFTFLPRRRNLGWPPYQLEDRVVTLLRERVRAARGSGAKPSAAPDRPMRSVMADDELDGPL